MQTIIQDGDPVLRETAKPVPVEEIASPAIQKIIADMKEALSVAPDGVAIAAPQIAVPLRIFVVAGKVFAENGTSPDLVFINPEIISLSEETQSMDEGCLSVHGSFGMVKRSLRARIKGYNEKAGETQMEGEGLLAQIFQHEIDHLNGILFIDKAEKIQNIKPHDA